MNIDPADPAVLRGAAKVIERGGLAKGSFSSHDGHCTVGALMAAKRATSSTFYVGAEAQLLARMISAEGGDPGSEWTCVAAWNDEPERTAEDVIELLEQAAEKAEADQ